MTGMWLCALWAGRKAGIIESKENQTDIYKNPRLYSMNYLKSISDLAQEVTCSPEQSNGSPITSAIQNWSEPSDRRYTAQNHQPMAPGTDYLSLVDFPSFSISDMFAEILEVQSELPSLGKHWHLHMHQHMWTKAVVRFFVLDGLGVPPQIASSQMRPFRLTKWKH